MLLAILLYFSYCALIYKQVATFSKGNLQNQQNKFYYYERLKPSLFHRFILSRIMIPLPLAKLLLNPFLLIPLSDAFREKKTVKTVFFFICTYLSACHFHTRNLILALSRSQLSSAKLKCHYGQKTSY